MHTALGIVGLDAAAVNESIRLAEQVTAADLTRPTPCADWTLHGLLRHMIAQHYGFAAAATGDGDPAGWRLRPLGDDPAAEYRAAAEHVLGAFAADGVLTRQFPLPEITRQPVFPGAQAVSFHFVDYVVHGWDVARTMDQPFELPTDVVAAALPLAFAVPDGSFRAGDSAVFGPAIPPTEPTNDLDRILAYLGRSPQWTPPVAARKP